MKFGGFGMADFTGVNLKDINIYFYIYKYLFVLLGKSVGETFWMCFGLGGFVGFVCPERL